MEVIVRTNESANWINISKRIRQLDLMDNGDLTASSYNQKVFKRF